MADTHINAYYGAVDLARQDVVAAQGRLSEAEAALEVKKREVGVVGAVDEPVATKPIEETAPTETPKTGVFKKK